MARRFIFSKALVLDAVVNAGKWTFEEATKRTLDELLNAALSAQILRHDRLSHAAKHYRNLVHPGREIRDRVQFPTPDANVAKAAVDITIREVREWYESRRAATNSQVAAAGN